jgi:hypothetical protein
MASHFFHVRERKNKHEEKERHNIRCELEVGRTRVSSLAREKVKTQNKENETGRVVV